jgi:hypothetical protein
VQACEPTDTFSPLFFSTLRWKRSTRAAPSKEVTALMPITK